MNAWKCKALLLALLFVLLTSVPAAAQWYTRSWEDPKTGQRMEGAEVLDRNGNHLMFFEYRDEVWAIFRLAKKSDVTMGSEMPVYQVDAYEPKSLSALATEQNRHLYVKEDKFVMWQVTAKDTKPSEDERIRQFLNGYSVIFRFETPQGEKKEVRFTLSGSMRNMTDALDLG
jgi:hypothetical protein